MNRKVYKTPEEKIDAMRQAIELRQKWENAIREGLSREEMEEIGLKSPKILEVIVTKKPFQFRQGLDVRLLNDEKAELLARSRYHGDMIFAFDNWREREWAKNRRGLQGKSEQDKVR